MHDVDLVRLVDDDVAQVLQRELARDGGARLTSTDLVYCGCTYACTSPQGAAVWLSRTL